jgi:hypothetical protein
MTWDVIDLGRGMAHDAAMNLTTFLIADSVLLIRKREGSFA